MTKKTKILWSGDIIAKTGFARVTEAIVTRLKDKYEFVVLGNNYWGDPHPLCKDFVIYPSSNRFQQEPFGVQRIREIVEREKPEIVIVNNDCWITNALYEQIQDLHDRKLFKFVAYVPIDSYGWTGCLADYTNKWDALISYTEFGVQEFFRAGVKTPIHVIHHGIEEGMFYPKDRKESRKSLGLKEDDFICFNGNRNQPRKRIDITIAGFAQFAVDRPDTKLYLHMGLVDQGWRVMEVFGREMRDRGLDPNGRIIMTAQGDMPPNVELDLLNTIYNCADVGINTCKGEGHGLVNHEHAACRVAQVVPNHTSCKEIFEGHGRLINCDHIDTDTSFSRQMPCPSAEHLAEILADLYENREKLDATAELCYLRATDPRYQWDNIADQFGGVFQEVLQDEQLESAESVSYKKKGVSKRKRRKMSISD